jgi:hypothetical protein
MLHKDEDSSDDSHASENTSNASSVVGTMRGGNRKSVVSQ